MHFSYKIKSLQKSKNENRRFRAWLNDEESETLTFFNDEVYFSTIIFKGALVLDNMTLKKSEEKVIVNVKFNKWSKYIISAIYFLFYAFYIFNIPNDLIFHGTLSVLFIGLLMYLVSYPIIRYDVKSALINELK